MHITEPVEYLYLCLMRRWEQTAPPDRHQGLLDGEPERNTQISRFAYVLRKIAAGSDESVFVTLARFTRRNDGESYISKNASWMEEPYPLGDGWYFEGCTSLKQKQEILQNLRWVGMSSVFVACAEDFVAGTSVAKYEPTSTEADAVLRRIHESEDLGET